MTGMKDIGGKNRWRSHVWPLLLLGVVTAVALLYYLRTELAFTGGRLGAPLDDAWIHFQFARNLSQGHGFSYNPGEPQPGSTAPLWTLLLAGVGLFTHEFLVPALLLSAFFLLLTVWLSYGFAAWLTGSRGAGLLAGLGVALAGRLLWAGLAGMETTAFAALSVAAVWLYARQGLRPLPTFLFALACQLRPEGHALFALALVDTAWQWLIVNGQWAMGNGKGLVKQVGVALMIYVAVALPYTLFSLSVTGQPLPNTFYAKVGAEHLFSWRTFRETAWLHWSDNPAALLMAFVGLAPTWRRSRLTVLWLVGLPLLTAVIIDQTWHHGRYTMPLIPFQMIVAAVGAYWVTGKLEIRDWRLPTISNLQSPISFLFAALLLLGASWQFRPWANMLAQNVNEVLEIDVALGEWLAANTPPDALIAVDDIGAIAFLSGRRIVDMNGLISPEVWPAVRQPVGLARDTRLTRILSQSRPDVIVAFPLWHWPLTQNTAVAHPIHSVQTGTHTIIFQPEAVVYAANWPYVAAAAPATAVNAIFGNAIELVGYDETVGATAVKLTFYWRSLAPVMADYDVFVHLLDENGNIVAQADQQPLNGLAPTGQWQPGDMIRHPLAIPLPPDLPAGVYTLRTGLYLRETGERLTAVGDTVMLGDVAVTRNP
ncbi:MAG TPA: hypothetical protein PLD25_03410 [Chloroflexota bacterium]|nr:hypothetical protein [Chloroflexota bacterium]